MIVLVVVAFVPARAGAADPDPHDLFRTGRYAECVTACSESLAKWSNDERIWTLKIQAEATQGKYDDALKTADAARMKLPGEVLVQLQAYEIYRTGGREKETAETLTAIGKLIEDRSSYTTAERIAVGRFLLTRGKDAKEVLDQYFTAVTKKEPEFVDGHLATAELALGKNDRAFAAEVLQKAPKEAARDPRFHYLLARTFADDDHEKAEKALNEALKINPRHVDSLLVRVDDRLDNEDHAGADAILRQVLAVDPKEPRAWAYRAAIAHLTGAAAAEKTAYATALDRWSTNPQVEHLIGQKLSRKYRFAEGSAHQRKALAFDKTYLPAKAQLCQDLLRLGEEAEGWKLAAEVFAADGYNVVAFNLVTLKDHLAKFRALAGDGFVLRMDPLEADLYGHRALAVLQKARSTLATKYGIKLDRAVTVEIFPRKQDFAVRTFGLPGADGFLGVCFGPVITANSPASQGKDPSNWEAVLWHEYCHTVTLHKTRNRMPRWLSEGISVYEERRENPAWGQWLQPRYREMILGDDLTPVSKLSSAFLNPKSGLHVQFAYFESAMVVEFLIERHGFDNLKAILDDLGAGVPINEALARRTGGSLEKLDREFAEFARKKVNASNATWEKLDLPEKADSTAVRAWLEKHPKNLPGRQRLAATLVREEKWAEAETAAWEFRKLDPEFIGSPNAYELLAAVYRKRGETTEESKALEELARRDGDAMAVYQRLAELGEASGNWTAVAKNARRWLAVNPLVPAPHRALASAAEKLNERGDALASLRALLALSPPDSADLRYRLAVQFDKAGERDKAKREVLKSLEEAPRSRDAQALLLKLAETGPPTKGK